MTQTPNSKATQDLDSPSSGLKDETLKSQNIAETESRGFEYGVIHWRSKQRGVLADQIEQSLQINKQELKRLVELGAIYHNHGRMTDWEEFLAESPSQTYLRLHTKPRRFDIRLNWKEKIIFSNDDFLIVNKPAGIPCHPTVDNIQENLISALSFELGQNVLITHRLDVGTSGLLVLARTKIFQAEFNQELKLGRVKKIYETLVEGQPDWADGTLLTHWLEPSPRAPKKMSKSETNGWAECRLRILKCEKDSENTQDANHSRLSIELLTGRTHQIRAQLSTEGHPLVGDRIYGATQLLNLETLMTGRIAGRQEFLLQSRKLEFEHREKKYFFDLGSLDHHSQSSGLLPRST